ncbi:MAG: Mov34/MPN/PAD-1 family protein [Candidatus Sericytochromatia bacterium]|nr:Mov34/MPN/PAD-1 family protein [Candidatus Sericytochromatia bacterium]
MSRGPSPHIRWPGLAEGAPEVYLAAGLGQVLCEFAVRSAREGREHGAFLLGRARHAPTGWSIVIERLEEVSGEGDGASFTFPAEAFLKMHHHHRTWSMDEVRARPEAVHVVGWCHTHPGHGVFLSAPDREVHARKFPLPFQVALVIDPMAEPATSRAGLVTWVGEGLLGPHLPGEIPTLDPMEMQAAPSPRHEPRPGSPWWMLVLAGAAGWWLWHGLSRTT